MTINELVEQKKITKYECSVFLMFTSEIGKKFTKLATNELFMSEPTELNACNLAFLEGRRSIFRDITAIISNITKMMEKK